jgi:hypothetical protein
MYIRRVRQPFKDGHLVPIKKEINRGGTIFLRTLYIKPPSNETKPKKNSYPAELKEEAIRLYDENKMSAGQVAERLGVSATTALDWITKNGKKRSRSEAGILNYMNGNGQDNYRTATYYWQSKKTGKWEFGGSKLELARMVQLDSKNNDVVYWTKKVDRVEYDGGRLYLPDFYIEYKDGRKVVEEIKPTYKLNDPVNLKKFSAASNYFKRLGYEYKVVTENDIGVKFINSLDYRGLSYISPERKEELKKQWRSEYRIKNAVQIKKYDKERHEANKEQNNQISRNYKADNKEKIKEYNKKYRQDNKEQILKRQREYQTNNKEKWRLYAQQRRAKMREQTEGLVKSLLSQPHYELIKALKMGLYLLHR